ncbi:hypothetical protein TSUD_418690, partial [Trifolium subterraneum]
MAPKKNLSSKKAKTDAGSSKATTSRSTRSKSTAVFDAARFIGADQFERFKALQKRKIWAEKVFDILPTGMYRDFVEVVQERGWDKLLNPHETINEDLVREFYANAVPTDEDAPFSFTTMIRGHPLRFDRDAIHAYLGNPEIVVNEAGLCPYARILAQGNWNVDHMTKKLLVPDRNIKFNSAGFPLRAMRGDMKPKAQLTLLFILHNILPRSHLSDAPMNILGLLYCVHAGKDVDVARVIANEMKIIASSGVTDHTRPKCMLAFPALIMGLIKDERIPVPQHYHQTLERIDDVY